MFKSFLGNEVDKSVNNAKIKELAVKSEGYSGNDIWLVCKEAAMEGLRRYLDKLREKFGDNYLEERDVKPDPEKITMKDLEIALQRTKPSNMIDSKIYEDWQKKYGVE